MNEMKLLSLLPLGIGVAVNRSPQPSLAEKHAYYKKKGATHYYEGNYYIRSRKGKWLKNRCLNQWGPIPVPSNHQYFEVL